MVYLFLANGFEEIEALNKQVEQETAELRKLLGL